MKMLADVITDYCCKRNIIDENKKEIYCYGFQLIISDIVNHAIIISLGIILDKILDSIIFLITLCTIRQFCGGFHAKTFIICRLSFVATFISVLAISSLLSGIGTGFVILINVICIIFISYFAPIEHHNKPMTTLQKKRNKIKSIITSLIVSVVSVVFSAIDINVGVTISITLCAVVMLMLISIIMRKEERRYV